MSLVTVTLGSKVVQWWDHSPPTNVFRIQIQASTPYISYMGWVCCWFSSVSSGITGFPLPKKPTLPNSDSIRTLLNKLLRTPMCFVDKKNYNYNYIPRGRERGKGRVWSTRCTTPIVSPLFLARRKRETREGIRPMNSLLTQILCTYTVIYNSMTSEKLFSDRAIFVWP